MNEHISCPDFQKEEDSSAQGYEADTENGLSYLQAIRHKRRLEGLTKPLSKSSLYSLFLFESNIIECLK